MKRLLYLLVSTTAVLALSVAIAAAQTTSPSGSPGAGGMSPGATPATPSLPVEKMVDGPVKKVDQASNTVQVGWLFGLLSTTLAVTDDTQIAVEGAKGSLADIQEGDRVKAAYEVREGKNIAKSIEITHGELTGGASTPGAKSGSGSSPMQAPGGSSASPSGAPKTP